MSCRLAAFGRRGGAAVKRPGLIRGILLAFGEMAVLLLLWVSAIAVLYIGAGLGH